MPCISDTTVNRLLPSPQSSLFSFPQILIPSNATPPAFIELYSTACAPRRRLPTPAYAHLRLRPVWAAGRRLTRPALPEPELASNDPTLTPRCILLGCSRLARPSQHSTTFAALTTLATLAASQLPSPGPRIAPVKGGAAIVRLTVHRRIRESYR